MMKKVFSLFVVILCCILCVAQNINQEKLAKDWGKLVDYVNCKYVSAYISNNKTDPSFNKYLQNIKPKIDSCSINNSIGYDNLSKLLKENGWSQTEEKICSIINNRKNLQPDIAVLLDISCFDSQQVQPSLSECKNSLEKELNGIYMEKNVTVENTDNYSDNNEQESSNGNLLLWILLGVVILEGLCIAFLWRRSMYIPDDEYIKDVCCDSKRLDDKFQLKIQQYVNDVEVLKKRLSALESNISKQAYKQSDVVEKREIKNTEKILPEIKPEIVKYAKNVGGGYLQECQQNKAQYELKLKDSSSNEASFVFCGEQKTALAQIDPTFKDVCETKDYKDSANRVEMQKNGKAILQDDDMWKVIEKGIVKFS